MPAAPSERDRSRAGSARRDPVARTGPGAPVRVGAATAAAGPAPAAVAVTIIGAQGVATVPWPVTVVAAAARNRRPVAPGGVAPRPGRPLIPSEAVARAAVVAQGVARPVPVQPGIAGGATGITGRPAGVAARAERVVGVATDWRDRRSSARAGSMVVAVAAHHPTFPEGTRGRASR
ncbi:MAG TPA: hypothetical protein VGT61_00490 [Thermomicrobiales bacterium]|nr:hypothetical protein [Thermomicrobiales bacterium]